MIGILSCVAAELLFPFAAPVASARARSQTHITHTHTHTRLPFPLGATTSRCLTCCTVLKQTCQKRKQKRYGKPISLVVFFCASPTTTSTRKQSDDLIVSFGPDDKRGGGGEGGGKGAEEVLALAVRPKCCDQAFFFFFLPGPPFPPGKLPIFPEATLGARARRSRFRVAWAAATLKARPGKGALARRHFPALDRI
jgi:hypothetical protein